MLFDCKRSAALDAGRMFEAAVQDIEYAFKYGYPKELQFKVGMDGVGSMRHVVSYAQARNIR